MYQAPSNPPPSQLLPPQPNISSSMNNNNNNNNNNTITMSNPNNHHMFSSDPSQHFYNSNPPHLSSDYPVLTSSSSTTPPPNTLTGIKGSLSINDREKYIGTKFIAQINAPIHLANYTNNQVSNNNGSNLDSSILGHFISVNIGEQMFRGCIFSDNTVVTLQPLELATKQNIWPMQEEKSTLHDPASHNTNNKNITDQEMILSDHTSDDDSSSGNTDQNASMRY